MNLEDIVGEEGLQQDEWSLSKPSFGEEGQLEVVGWSGKRKTHKYYVLRCSKCSQDSELFGEGYFRRLKGNLVSGQAPCGCSKKPQWSKEQYSVLCSRKAKEFGYTFLGFEEEWKGAYTKIRMLCPKHGEWNTGNTNDLINGGRGCPGCKADKLGENSTKPDDVMIASFFASSAFHPDTKFWRSGRKKVDGYKGYWFMSCPDCAEIGEATSNNLQQGKRPCACNMHRPQECYINWIIDDYNIIAIKFGVARDSKQRIKQQNSKSVYTLKQHSIYTFPSVQQCKSAELECKQTLETRVISRTELPDGWSETTWVYNLDKIVEIYERNGGVRQENT